MTCDAAQASKIPQESHRRRTATVGSAGGYTLTRLARLDDDHQILVVGDVVGHGIEAAAHSAMFRHTLRTLCLSGFPMAAVLHKLDQLIYRDSRQPSGTLLILEVQVSTRTLTLTAAGHPPPIIVSASGESRVIDVEPNTLLGFGLVAKHAASTSIRLEITFAGASPRLRRHCCTSSRCWYDCR